MENKTYSVQFIQAVVNYLITKPYGEVAQLIAGLVGNEEAQKAMTSKEEPKEDKENAKS